MSCRLCYEEDSWRCSQCDVQVCPLCRESHERHCHMKATTHQSYSPHAMPIGRHKGKPWNKIPITYLVWAMNFEKIPRDVRDKCWEEVRRRRDRKVSHEGRTA